jgi:transmembrane sensor
MTNSNATKPDLEAAKRQALEWLAHLSSGQATQEDGEALRSWCATNPAHAQAFAEASLLWEVLGPAARNVAARAAAQQSRVAEPQRVTQSVIGRRSLIGGSLVAASAAAAGYLIVRPPLELWPSLPALMAQYRTKTGERRQLAMAGGGVLEMNTAS